MFAPSLSALGAFLSNGEKKVFFVRHGQSESNVLFEAGKDRKARSLRDPDLSERGKKQAMAVAHDPLLRDLLAAPGRDELLVVSPMRRAIATALNAFSAWVAERAADGAPVSVALSPDIQECDECPCDCGRPTSQLRDEFAAEFPFLPFDTLPENWYEKRGDYRFTDSALRTRLARFTRWVQQRPESTVIVVAHHEVFEHMLGADFANCEVRLYTIGAAGGAGGHLPLVPPWRAVWPPPLPPRSHLVCAVPGCQLAVHRLEEFGPFCCYRCAEGTGHGERCERRHAPPGAKKLSEHGEVTWTEHELAEMLASGA